MKIHYDSTGPVAAANDPDWQAVQTEGAAELSPAIPNIYKR
jgi:hypothetical protein